MPTYELSVRFKRDFERLTVGDQAAFRVAVERFVADLGSGRGFRQGLRVKGVQGAPNVFEMTWAPDGRATFEFGPQHTEGAPHVIWRRVGTHAVLKRP